MCLTNKRSSKEVLINDNTLRDGNHVVSHQLTLDDVKLYAEKADRAGIDIIEVGHGCGLGGSSLQFGSSPNTDEAMLKSARDVIKQAKIGVHIIPGIGKTRDLDIAMGCGVEVFRVASYCAEANTTKIHINYLKNRDKIVLGTLMMIHHISAERLAEQAKIMSDFGVDAIIIMDSAGALMPHEVQQRISLVIEKTGLMVGFHAHNNLEFAVANSIAAIQAGATLVDGTAVGFGAGAGNAPIEVIIAVLNKLNYQTRARLSEYIQATDCARAHFLKKIPQLQASSLLSGYHGVFSGYVKHVDRIAQKYNVPIERIYEEIGRRKLIAGQEDQILQIVEELQQTA